MRDADIDELFKAGKIVKEFNLDLDMTNEELFSWFKIVL